MTTILEIQLYVGQKLSMGNGVSVDFFGKNKLEWVPPRPRTLDSPVGEEPGGTTNKSALNTAWKKWKIWIRLLTLPEGKDKGRSTEQSKLLEQGNPSFLASWLGFLTEGRRNQSKSSVDLPGVPRHGTRRRSRGGGRLGLVRLALLGGSGSRRASERDAARSGEEDRSVRLGFDSRERFRDEKKSP